MGVGGRHFRGGCGGRFFEVLGHHPTFGLAPDAMCQPSRGRVRGWFPRLRESQTTMSRRPSQSDQCRDPPTKRGRTLFASWKSPRSGSKSPLAKTKKKHQCCPRWSQIKFCDEIHRAHPEEGGNKGRRDCQERRGRLSFAGSASR